MENDYLVLKLHKGIDVRACAEQCLVGWMQPKTKKLKLKIHKGFNFS